jgi:pimeloyl-ACP methyl ester carboxylesterase
VPSFAKLLLALDRAAAGLRQREIQVDEHRIVYAEGGRGETVLLLHGFGSNQGSWNRVAKTLTKTYRVIAPDLPGWGSSTRIATASYASPDQVERVHRMVQELKLERFHLVGHSMGGGIAARYAARYPDEVLTLGLVAARGIIEPHESELRRSVTRGDANWLLVSSPHDFQILLEHLFVRRPHAPRVVIKYLERDAISKCEQNRRIFDDLQGDDPPLLDLLPQIKAPALVIWGDKDRLIDVSAAEVFKTTIKRAQALILPNCGHMPIIERARECAETYMAFLREQAMARS